MRRKQFDAMKGMKLTPEQWCAILGLRMIDPDGWNKYEEDYSVPVDLPGFYSRAASSTMGFEDGSTDFFDVENFVAEDEQSGVSALPEGTI